MVRLANRLNAPPNGFWVTVPQADYNAQFWDFESAVGALWALMQKNPGLSQRFPQLPKTRAQCEEFVDAQNALRVSLIRGAQTYITEGGPAIPVPFPTAKSTGNFFRHVVAGAGRVPPQWFKKLGQIKTGAITIGDWLGHGGVPVAETLSGKRAEVCATCPKNQQGDPDGFFTKGASEILRRQLAERDQMKLSTPQDEKLGVCSACGCPLKLKVHCPLEFIKRHMPAAQTAELDPECWVRKET